MRISPSKLQAWSICPCFEYQETTDSGAEGTRLHEIMATKDLSKAETEDERQLCEKMEVFAQGVVAGMPSDVTERNEVRISFLDGIRGTLDRIYFSAQAKHAIVMDWKTGRRGIPTAAAENYQLMAYALGTFELLGDAVETVRVFLVAPRTEEADSHSYRRSDLEHIKTWLRDVIDNVEDPFKKPRNKSPELCSMCAQSHRCPAVNKAMETLPKVTANILLPELFKPVEEMQEMDLSRFLLFSDMVSTWLDQRRDAIVQRALKDNLVLPGYKSVKRAGGLRVTDTPEAIRILRTAMPEAELWKCVRLNVTQLRKVLENTEDVLMPILEKCPDTTYLMKTREARFIQITGGSDVKPELAAGAPTGKRTDT